MQQRQLFEESLIIFLITFILSVNNDLLKIESISAGTIRMGIRGGEGEEERGTKKGKGRVGREDRGEIF